MLSTFKLVGEDQTGNWSREIDYIWMGRRLLGTEEDPGGANPVVKHYHTDHLGSIRLVTDSAGNKVSEHEYLPYGQELTAAGNGVMKFTGHERDSDTGMDYMHARFYKGYLGRFMSVDRVRGYVGLPGSMNRYSYSWNRPVNWIDPDGRNPLLVCAGSGALLYLTGLGLDIVSHLADDPATSKKLHAWGSWTKFAGGAVALCGIGSAAGAVGTGIAAGTMAAAAIDSGFHAATDTAAYQDENANGTPETETDESPPEQEQGVDGGSDNGDAGDGGNGDGPPDDQGDCITCGFGRGGAREGFDILNADWPYEWIEFSIRYTHPGGYGGCRWVPNDRVDGHGDDCDGPGPTCTATTNTPSYRLVCSGGNTQAYFD